MFVMIRVRFALGVVFGLLALTQLRADDSLPEVVKFNRDIRPILADTCFACHGPDQNKREADLRLDTEKGVQDASVIVPGKPSESELVQRILSDDPDKKMPPPTSNKTLL